MGNYHATVREFVEDVGITKDSVEAILKDFMGVKRLSVKFVPKSLNFLQSC